MMSTLDRYLGKSILGAILLPNYASRGFPALLSLVKQFRSVGKVPTIFVSDSLRCWRSQRR